MRATGRSAVAVLAALAAGVAAGPAAGAPVVPPAPPPGYGVAVYEQRLDDAGDPLLVAITEDGGGAVSWRACDPGCGAVIGTDSYLQPGPTPAGTVFQVTATVGGTVRTASSTPWHGRVAIATPPALAGEVRIGRTVTPAAGTWTGGWDGDVDLTEVRACRTADGADCRTLSAFSPGGGPATIDPAYAGWYVGAVDRRFGPDPVTGGIPPTVQPFGTVADLRGATASATVALGPLTGPVPAERAGTPPTVSGRLAAGSVVRATPGTWPDAPDDPLVATGLRACPTPHDGPRCTVIARAGEDELATGNRGRATLGRNLLGWYVGAFERHGRKALGTRGLAPDDPAQDALPVPGIAVVVGPLSSTPVRLGHTPQVSLRTAVPGRGTRLALGTVRCTGRCVVRLEVRAGGRRLTRTVRGGGTIGVSVHRSALPRATRRLRVRIRVDDSTVDVRRTVRLR